MSDKAITDPLTEEAFKRIMLLGLSGPEVGSFMSFNTLYYSERENGLRTGVLKEAETNKSVYDEMIGLGDQSIHVYFAQLTHTTKGDILTVLYLEDSGDDKTVKEKWRRAKEDLKKGVITEAIQLNLSKEKSMVIGRGIKFKKGSGKVGNIGFTIDTCADSLVKNKKKKGGK